MDVFICQMQYYIIINPSAEINNNKVSNKLCRSLLAFYLSNYKELKRIITIEVSLYQASVSACSALVKCVVIFY